MEIAPPTNTPPPQYTPPAPAPAPAPPAPAPKKRGEATDIRPKVVTLIRRHYLSLFEEKVKKHDRKLTGSTVVDDWRRTTSDQIYGLIEAGTPPFENITLSAGMRKANLGVSTISSVLVRRTNFVFSVGNQSRFPQSLPRQVEEGQCWWSQRGHRALASGCDEDY